MPLHLTFGAVMKSKHCCHASMLIVLLQQNIFTSLRDEKNTSTSIPSGEA